MITSLFQFPQFIDERGSLVTIHGNKDIPFVIQRVFYIYHVDLDVRRGVHAHKISQEVLICLKGHCSVVLDNGQYRQTHLLNDPVQGLFIDHGIWLEIDQFSADCLLMVLSSTDYDPDDDIDDYEDFLKYRDQVNAR